MIFHKELSQDLLKYIYKPSDKDSTSSLINFFFRNLFYFTIKIIILYIVYYFLKETALKVYAIKKLVIDDSPKVIKKNRVEINDDHFNNLFNQKAPMAANIFKTPSNDFKWIDLYTNKAYEYFYCQFMDIIDCNNPIEFIQIVDMSYWNYHKEYIRKALMMCYLYDSLGIKITVGNNNLKYILKNEKKNMKNYQNLLDKLQFVKKKNKNNKLEKHPNELTEKQCCKDENNIINTIINRLNNRKGQYIFKSLILRIEEENVFADIFSILMNLIYFIPFHFHVGHMIRGDMSTNFQRRNIKKRKKLFYELFNGPIYGQKDSNDLNFKENLPIFVYIYRIIERFLNEFDENKFQKFLKT